MAFWEAFPGRLTDPAKKPKELFLLVGVVIVLPTPSLRNQVGASADSPLIVVAKDFDAARGVSRIDEAQSSPADPEGLERTERDGF